MSDGRPYTVERQIADPTGLHTPSANRRAAAGVRAIATVCWLLAGTVGVAFVCSVSSELSIELLSLPAMLLLLTLGVYVVAVPGVPALALSRMVRPVRRGRRPAVADCLIFVTVLLAFAVLLVVAISLELLERFKRFDFEPHNSVRKMIFAWIAAVSIAVALGVCIRALLNAEPQSEDSREPVAPG